MAEKDHIVVLEACHAPLPKFNIPHKYTEYFDTQPHEIAERIKDATIVITTMREVTIECAEHAPRLGLIVVMGTGCGWVDEKTKNYYSKRGITISNTPHSNIPSVSTHALGLYFAVRRRLLHMHTLTTTTSEWPARGSLTALWERGPPLSCSQEVVGIIGYGALGQAIAKLCRGVGMGEVIIAERKGVPAEEVREGKEAFESVVRRCTVLFVCCPRDSSTIDLISRPELSSMQPDAVVINMARGGIVNETALVSSLRSRTIYGAATDVFENEPGERGKSPLLPGDGEEEVPNLTVSPHVAWFAQETIVNLQRLLRGAVEGWKRGGACNVVVGPEP